MHFSLQKATLGPKVRFGSSGSPRRGPGTAPEGSPEGGSPGPLRFRGGRENVVKNKAKLANTPRGHGALINKAVVNSAPAGEPGDPSGRPRRTFPPFSPKVLFWGFWAEKSTLGAFYRKSAFFAPKCGFGPKSATFAIWDPPVGWRAGGWMDGGEWGWGW